MDFVQTVLNLPAGKEAMTKLELIDFSVCLYNLSKIGIIDIGFVSSNCMSDIRSIEQWVKCPGGRGLS